MILFTHINYAIPLHSRRSNLLLDRITNKPVMEQCAMRRLMWVATCSQWVSLHRLSHRYTYLPSPSITRAFLPDTSLACNSGTIGDHSERADIAYSLRTSEVPIFHWHPIIPGSRLSKPQMYSFIAPGLLTGSKYYVLGSFVLFGPQFFQYRGGYGAWYFSTNFLGTSCQSVTRVGVSFLVPSPEFGILRRALW